jgi:microcystin-dependent protein
MAEAYLGEIRMFAGNFPPRNWAFCEGQTLNVSQFSELFSLLGTKYGGNGTTTFELPDLRGRVPVHQGTGVGLAPRSIGQKFGEERVSLSVDQLPSHSHTMRASSELANSKTPANALPAQTELPLNIYSPYVSGEEETYYANGVSDQGGNQEHNNMQPYMCVSFIICTQNGYYPSRN